MNDGPLVRLQVNSSHSELVTQWTRHKSERVCKTKHSFMHC